MPSFDKVVVDKKSTFPVPIASGEEVIVTADFGKMRGDFMELLSSEADEAKAYIMTCEVMAECILEWDITHPVTVLTDTPDGAVGGDPVTTEVPYPITKESIIALPIGFVGEVFQKMQEAANPQKKTESSFGAG